MNVMARNSLQVPYGALADGEVVVENQAGIGSRLLCHLSALLQLGRVYIIEC